MSSRPIRSIAPIRCFRHIALAVSTAMACWLCLDVRYSTTAPSSTAVSNAAVRATAVFPSPVGAWASRWVRWLMHILASSRNSAWPSRTRACGNSPPPSEPSASRRMSQASMRLPSPSGLAFLDINRRLRSRCGRWNAIPAPGIRKVDKRRDGTSHRWGPRQNGSARRRSLPSSCSSRC